MSGAAVLNRAVGLVATVVLSLVWLYTSRFWIWTAPWGNEGLFGIKLLSPYGDIVRRATGGTLLNEFDIVIWGCAGPVVLSVLQWITRRIIR